MWILFEFKMAKSLSEPSALWYSLRPCLEWGAWLEARLVASLKPQTAEHRAATGESQSVRDPRDGNTSLRRPETENTDNYGATLRVTWSDIEWHHHGLGPHQRWDPLQAELHHQVDLGDSGGHHLQRHPRGGPQGREPPRLWRGCCPPSLCPCGDLEVSLPQEKSNNIYEVTIKSYPHSNVLFWKYFTNHSGILHAAVNKVGGSRISVQ